MAFTKEEIRNALVNENKSWPYLFVDKKEFENNPTYPAVVDYFMGKIPLLQSLPQSPISYIWCAQLLPLIKNFQEPNINDQLILDFFYHPDVDQSSKFLFLNAALSYSLHKLNEDSFQALFIYYRRFGFNDENIFSHIINHIDSIKDGDINHLLMKSSFINEFISNFLYKGKQLFYPLNQLTYHHTSTWNSEYFKLLENVRPDFVEEYVGFGILKNPSHLIPFFIKYNSGHYVSGIIEYLNNTQQFTPAITEKRFEASLYLYMNAPDIHKDFIVKNAIEYLNEYSINSKINQWENYFILNEFEKSRLPYSTNAFYLLFKYNASKALEILKKWLNEKVFINEKTIEFLFIFSNENILPFIENILSTEKGGADYLIAILDLSIKYFDDNTNIKLLWSLSATKSKPLRNKIIELLLVKDIHTKQKAITFLQSRKAEIRQTAATILSHFNSTDAQEAVINVLNQETNDNVRDIMLTSVSSMLPNETNSTFVNEMIEAAAKRGKLTKPLETWLDEANLPALFYADESELPSEAVRFLLYRMSRVKIMQSDIEAKYLIQLLDKEKAAPFAKALIKLFAENGAKPEHKYLLALAALLGNDEIVDYISRTINRWIDESRYKMAEYGVGALAIQGSDKALRKVEWYSRKYKVKKANVGAAALLALETAATELNITIQELGDRVVPDFGFEGLFKTITIDNEEYRAFIDSNFKIAFFNEDNKKLKALPSNASKEIKDELKDIGKEVRDVVKSQSSRLEYYLVIQRRWPITQWQQFFLENPVMFIYATKLVWGIYNSGENLQATFYCNENTELMNVEGDEITLPEEGFIGMVHPIQLSPTDLQAWKKLLFEQSIQPIFLQLDRPKADLSGIDLDKPIITKFKDKQTENESIRNILEKRGWNKGPTGDGGMIESYNLLYFEKRIEAILEIEGVGAGYGWGGDQRTGNLYVINKKNVATKWFSSPQNNEDERLVNPKDLPPIFLNEMLAAVEAIKFKTAG